MAAAPRASGSGSKFQKYSPPTRDATGQIIKKGTRLPWDGTWVYRVTIDGKKRSFYGRSQSAAKLVAQKAKGQVALVASGTLEAFLECWLEEQKDLLKPQTSRRYAQLLKLHVVPHLGSRKLASLTEQDVADLHATLARGNGRKPLGSTTRRHVHVVLGGALKDAVSRKLLAVNPIHKGDRRPKNDHAENVPLTRAQARKLLDVARGTEYESLYVLALTTGMRPGEYMALHWSDIDTERSTVTVRGNVVKGHSGWEISTPKTKGSRRTITLAPIAVEALTALRGDAPDGALLFGDRHGHPIGATNIARDHFRPLCKLAGLPAATTLYTLRHTAATLMLGDGVPLRAVSRMLGHSSSVVTLNHYDHYMPADDEVGAASAQNLYA
jgi:integrase